MMESWGHLSCSFVQAECLLSEVDSIPVRQMAESKLKAAKVARR